jgi:1,4-dihydroxy-2-naphthoyl-CoA hydrolase
MPEQMHTDSIWFESNPNLIQFEKLAQNTMGHYLSMEWVERGANFFKMKMPINERTRQPYGVLHGGASTALAETVGSIASFMVIDSQKFICVGLEINANHLKSVKDGFVTATATPLHLGNSTHVWDIKIVDEQSRLVCVSRLTVAILPKK